jgi:hypothetical protein
MNPPSGRRPLRGSRTGIAQPGEAPPDRKAVKAVLAYLPIFEAEGFAFGEIKQHAGALPHASYAPELNAFVRALYECQFIVSFDWAVVAPARRGVLQRSASTCRRRPHDAPKAPHLDGARGQIL